MCRIHFKSVVVLSLLLLAGCKSGPFKKGALVVFPDYPRIQRNFDYSVSVTQGATTEQLTVYNSVRQKTKMDKYRRFCEFAFSGAPVRVDISVHYDDIKSYCVMPSSYKLASTIKDNVISVYLNEPKPFLLKINDDYTSILSVFAEDSQRVAAAPDKSDPSVIFYEKGWHDAEGGFLKIDKAQTLYLAPGAVLNARVQSSRNNLTICGYGMIRDPFDDRMKNAHGETYVVNVKKADNVTIKDIKVVDCRFYHIHFGGCSNSLIENVKLLSNQISTDGFTVNGPDITIRNCFAYIGDDVFTGKGANMHIHDCVVGDYGGGIISMDDVKQRTTIENIDVFHSYGAILRNRWGEKKDRGMKEFTISNLRAVDCSFTPFFFRGSDQGKGRKEFILKNISIGLPTGTTDRFSGPEKHTNTSWLIERGSDYVFDMENFWIGGELVTNSNQVIVKKNDATDPVFKIKGSEQSREACVASPHKVVLESVQRVPKLFIGEWQVNLKNRPVIVDGKCYVSIGDIAEVFGYSVKESKGGVVLEKPEREIEIDGQKGTVDGRDIAVEGSVLIRDNRVLVNSGLLKICLGTEVNWDAEKMILRVDNINEGKNLLENPGFEEHFGQWTASGFANIFRDDDAFSGRKSLHVIPEKPRYQGVFQEVSDQLNRYGRGKYRLTYYAKAGNRTNHNQMKTGFLCQDRSPKRKVRRHIITLTKEWKQYSTEYHLDWHEGSLHNALFIIQACAENQMDFYVDNLQLIKVE